MLLAPLLWWLCSCQNKSYYSSTLTCFLGENTLIYFKVACALADMADRRFHNQSPPGLSLGNNLLPKLIHIYWYHVVRSEANGQELYRQETHTPDTHPNMQSLMLLLDCFWNCQKVPKFICFSSALIKIRACRCSSWTEDMMSAGDINTEMECLD